MSGGRVGDEDLARRRARRLGEDRIRRTRRRRLGGLALLAAVAAAVGFVAGSSTEDGSPGNDVAATREPACAKGPDWPLRRVLGQRLMVRITDEATGRLLRAARRGEIGGVIAFPPAGTDPRDLARELRRLQRAAKDGGSPPLLVSTDQEGGPVKRFAEAPPARSPAVLAASGDVGAARSQGEATGRFLRDAGVTMDLAPVLDLGEPGSFVAARTFGVDPGRVASLGIGFAQGLTAAAIVPVAKHFPGLGLASANSDLGPSVVAASREQLRPGLDPFRAAIDARIPAIMVSVATYPGYDPDEPAATSRRIVTGLLRRRLSFGGVVVTDDLQAGAVAAVAQPAEAAVAAARAGADVLLFAGGSGEGVLDRLLAAGQRGRLDAGAMRASCDRIVSLKVSSGGE